MKQLATVLMLVTLAACSREKNVQNGSPTANLSVNEAAFAPRIGVAVNTEGRACVAIRNASLTPGAPMTIIAPMAPQTFTHVDIGAAADSPCPVSKDVDRTVSNYVLHVPAGTSLPKMTPLIAVTGATPNVTITNNVVQADIDQNGTLESFRACSGNDGVHLTVWAGAPLDSVLLWHGYYYEPGNPGIGPACTPKETGGMTS